ncbi:MAG: cytochrome P450, partial [Acidimicrobiia bacterium]|nr:cytochrome P450 [Acidimicrobiia bacterium]
MPWRHQPRLLRRAFSRPHPFLDELRDRFGPVCRLGVGPMRIVVVGDPAMAAELLAMPNDRFRWKHKFNWFASVVGERSMLANDEPEHKRLRSAVQAGFSRRRLNGWIPMIIDRSDTAIDDLVASTASGDVVDLYPIGRALTLEIVTHALFGERLAGRSGEIGELMRNSQDYIAHPTPPHPFPWGRQSRVRADRRALDAIIDTEIAYHRNHPSGDPANILETLVTAGELTDEEIRDQVVTLVGAGFDTTAASLAWILWRATVTEGLWDRLGAEADTVLNLPSNDGPPADTSSLAALELADSVMHETLRLHPAGALTPREAAVDIDAGGYHIPAGTMVVWSAHLIGRDPAAWADPLRFDPTRHRDLTPDQ